MARRWRPKPWHGWQGRGPQRVISRILCSNPLNIFHFIDSTTDVDLKPMTAADDCPFKMYELQRLKNMATCISLFSYRKTCKFESITETKNYSVMCITS